MYLARPIVSLSMECHQEVSFNCCSNQCSLSGTWFSLWVLKIVCNNFVSTEQLVLDISIRGLGYVCQIRWYKTRKRLRSSGEATPTLVSANLWYQQYTRHRQRSECTFSFDISIWTTAPRHYREVGTLWTWDREVRWFSSSCLDWNFLLVDTRAASLDHPWVVSTSSTRSRRKLVMLPACM